MSLEHDQRETMELLAQNEEAASQLYKVCCEKYPKYWEFFETLCKEELVHASWIRRIYPEIDKGNLEFDKGRFKQEAILASIECARLQARRLINHEISLTEALKAAMDIENNSIESNFYEIYEADSGQLKDLLRALKDAFLEHRKRLEDMLDKVEAENT
ncbi:MAG: hypothetical protein ABH872_02465 [Candidatus Omnitrophota bacterium]